MSDGGLQGRVALITGASRGIGRAIALALAGEGVSVALAARTRADLEEVAQEVAQLGAAGWPAVCDVTDLRQVQRLPGEVEAALGPIDILVNSAGMAGSHKLVDHPDELWERLLEVNLTSVYRVSKAVAPRMIERKRGRMINIASVASKVGSKYMAAYAASKHGVLGLTRALAAELNPHGITVNAICPGYVDTPMADATLAMIMARTGRSREEAMQAILVTTPQRRLIQPEEVAAVAVMLASAEARGITGQAINVDGGAVMF